MSLKRLFKLKRLARARQNKKRRQEERGELIAEEDIQELWSQCPKCKTMSYTADLAENLHVCPKCDHHIRLGAYDRLQQLVDPGSWEELYSQLQPADPLSFADLKPYKQRVADTKQKCGSPEALVSGTASIKGHRCALAVMEFAYLGGSMGSVVGEKIARLIDLCCAEKRPLIMISASGGARMHEGLFSLMQMAKTSSALMQLAEAKLLAISLLTDPTYGGVSASFAMLGDILIAEPAAKIGFAGPRVIEETIRQKLPKDFQTAEYLLEHGQIDLVIHRHQLKDQLATLLQMHEQPIAKDHKQIDTLQKLGARQLGQVR